MDKYDVAAKLQKAIKKVEDPDEFMDLMEFYMECYSPTTIIVALMAEISELRKWPFPGEESSTIYKA